MHGNVWEWCWDWHATYATMSAENPNGAESGSARMLRRGSFQDGAFETRSSHRYPMYPDQRSSGFGFRVARNTS